MKWAALIGFWGTWLAFTAVVTVVVFIMTVFTSDNPANRAIADRLMNVMGITLLVALAGGVGAMLYRPGWPGWFIACGCTLLIPAVVIVCASAWMK